MSGYTVIYADPPWSYSDKGCNGAAEKQYPTLGIASLCALPVGQLAADDAALFLWATNPLLPEALQVIEAWGFRYKSVAFTWVKTYEKSGKPFYGLGRWTRGNKEDCLLAVKGKPRRADNSVFSLVEDSQVDVVTHPVTRHSAKPAIVRDRIVQLMGDVPRIELFARELADGWDATGNDLDGMDIRESLPILIDAAA